MPRMNATPMITDDTASEHHEHRSRLLEAMASVSASKGVAAATIADIVREAGVSKRTFYEYFDGKEACFLTLYRLTSASALRTLREAVLPDRPWQTQVEHALDAYFSHLAAGPGLVGTLFVEIHHLGPEGLRVRREVMAQFADFVLDTVNGGHGFGEAPLDRVLTPTMALAAVGGIHELVMLAIERGEVDQLQELTPSASAVVRLLTRADPT